MASASNFNRNSPNGEKSFSSYHINLIEQASHINSLDYYSNTKKSSVSNEMGPPQYDSLHSFYPNINTNNENIYKENCENIDATMPNMGIKNDSPKVDIKAFVEDINNTDFMINIHESDIINPKEINLPGLQGLAQVASNLKSSKLQDSQTNLLSTPLHIELPGSSPYGVGNIKMLKHQQRSSVYISQRPTAESMSNTSFVISSNPSLNLPSFSSFMNVENPASGSLSMSVSNSKMEESVKNKAFSTNSSFYMPINSLMAPFIPSNCAMNDISLHDKNLNILGVNNSGSGGCVSVAVPENEIQSIINANINLLGTWQKQLQAMSAFYSKGLTSINDKMLMNNSAALLDFPDGSQNLGSISNHQHPHQNSHLGGIPNIQIVQNNNVNNINHNTMNLLNNLAPLLNLVNHQDNNLNLLSTQPVPFSTPVSASNNFSTQLNHDINFPISLNSQNLVELLKRLSSLGLININENTLLALSNPLTLLQIQQLLPNVPTGKSNILNRLSSSSGNNLTRGFPFINPLASSSSLIQGMVPDHLAAQPFKLDNSALNFDSSSPFGVLNAAVALKQLIKNEEDACTEPYLMSNKFNIANLKPEEALLLLNSANALLTGNPGPSINFNGISASISSVAAALSSNSKSIAASAPCTTTTRTKTTAGSGSGVPNGNNNNCPFCSKCFKFKSNLHTHVKAVHKKIKPHACNICSKSFSLKQNMKTHMKNIHSGKSMLDDSSETAKQSPSPPSHTHDVGGKKEKAEIVISNNNYLNSPSTASAKPIKLAHGGFPSHRNGCSGSMAVLENRNVQPAEENAAAAASYSSLEDQYRNLLLSAAAAQVAIFGNSAGGPSIKSMPQNEDLSVNYSQEINHFVSNVAPNTVPQQKTRHRSNKKMKSHNHSLNIVESRTTPAQHINHDESGFDDNDGNHNNSKPVGAPRKNQLEDKNLIFCPKCDKNFTLKGNFNVHMRIVHEKARDFECPYCSKKFGLKANMMMHLNNVHKSKLDISSVADGGIDRHQVSNNASDQPALQSVATTTPLPSKTSKSRGRPRRNIPISYSDMADSFTSQVLSEIAREKMSSLVGEPYFSKINQQQWPPSGINVGSSHHIHHPYQQHTSPPFNQSHMEQYTLDECLSFGGQNSIGNNKLANCLVDASSFKSLAPPGYTVLPIGPGIAGSATLATPLQFDLSDGSGARELPGNGMVDHAAAAAVYLQYLQHQQKQNVTFEQPASDDMLHLPPNLLVRKSKFLQTSTASGTLHCSDAQHRGTTKSSNKTTTEPEGVFTQTRHQIYDSHKSPPQPSSHVEHLFPNYGDNAYLQPPPNVRFGGTIPQPHQQPNQQHNPFTHHSTFVDANSNQQQQTPSHPHQIGRHPAFENSDARHLTSGGNNNQNSRLHHHSSPNVPTAAVGMNNLQHHSQF